MKKILRGAWLAIDMAIELPVSALIAGWYSINVFIAELKYGGKFKDAITAGAKCMMLEGYALAKAMDAAIYWVKTGYHKECTLEDIIEMAEEEYMGA